MRWLYSLLMVLAQPGLRRKLARQATGMLNADDLKTINALLAN